MEAIQQASGTPSQYAWFFFHQYVLNVNYNSLLFKIGLF